MHPSQDAKLSDMHNQSTNSKTRLTNDPNNSIIFNETILDDVKQKYFESSYLTLQSSQPIEITNYEEKRSENPEEEEQDLIADWTLPIGLRLIWYTGVTLLLLIALVCVIVSIYYYLTDTNGEIEIKLYGIIASACLAVETFLVIFFDCCYDNCMFHEEEDVLDEIEKKKAIQRRKKRKQKAKKKAQEKRKLKLSMLQAQTSKVEVEGKPTETESVAEKPNLKSTDTQTDFLSTSEQQNVTSPVKSPVKNVNLPQTHLPSLGTSQHQHRLPHYLHPHFPTQFSKQNHIHQHNGHHHHHRHHHHQKGHGHSHGPLFEPFVCHICHKSHADEVNGSFVESIGIDTSDAFEPIIKAETTEPRVSTEVQTAVTRISKK